MDRQEGRTLPSYASSDTMLSFEHAHSMSTAHRLQNGRLRRALTVYDLPGILDR